MELIVFNASSSKSKYDIDNIPYFNSGGSLIKRAEADQKRL